MVGSLRFPRIRRLPLQRILRYLLPLAILALAAVGLTACGGGGDEASSSTDGNTLLGNTFTGKKDIKPGKFDLAVNVDVSGGNSGANGPFELKLSGPFETEGTKKLPKFDLELEANGQGQNIKAGVESTGTKAFVSFNGTDYAVPDNVYQQFKQGFEQAAAQSE